MSWIKLHRQIKENWIWSNPVKFQWWIDVLLSVNHADNKVLIKGTLIDCRRGQSIRSLESWAKDWKVTKKTVFMFFKLLEKDKMLETENLLVTTRITVCNYDIYNDKKTLIKKDKETVPTTQSKRDLPTNKNDKETITNVIVYSEEQKKSFEKFVEWQTKNTPKLLKMNQPFTIEQFVKMRKKIHYSDIIDVCEKMQNNKKLLNTYESAYKTFTNWYNKYSLNEN